MPTAPDFTQTLLHFLQQPASYPHLPRRVHLIQTHASVLAIAPPFVYKVKKHVDLGFMKFTTLEERKRNCERELALNSRFCSELYIGVEPLVLQEGQLCFGNGGPVVEYALKMHMLPDGYFMNQLLQHGRLTRTMLDAVLVVLHQFYRSHPSNTTIAAFGHVAAIRQVTDESLDLMEQLARQEVVQPAAVEAITAYVHGFLAGQETLFRKRVEELRIQDCHGDLHLDHIHIRKSRICIFDCIEFNDHFRYIDVASDIAFLAMDLDFNGRPDLAAYVAERMAHLLPDPDMLQLTDFYKCYRACVRAKVEGIRAAEAEVPGAEKQLSRERAGRYVSLALRYALFGSRPVVVLVMGNIGSGKTTLADALARLLGCRHLNSDVLRKQKAGVPLYKRLNPELRMRLYAREVSDAVYQDMLQQALELLTQREQMVVVVDAMFGSPDRRAFFVQALEAQKLPYFFLEMHASDEVLKQRLAQRDQSEQVVSDARLEDFEQLRQSYKEPADIRLQHLLRLDASEPVSAVLRQLLLGLVQRNLGTAGAMALPGNPLAC